jgi:hypothetical protein
MVDPHLLLFNAGCSQYMWSTSGFWRFSKLSTLFSYKIDLQPSFCSIFEAVAVTKGGFFAGFFIYFLRTVVTNAALPCPSENHQHPPIFFTCGVDFNLLYLSLIFLKT